MYQTVDFFVPDDEVGKIGLISCCHHQVVHQDSGEAYGELFLTAVHVAEFGAGVVEDVDAQVIEPVNHGVYGAEAFAFSSGLEQCHHQHMKFRVFGGSVEEGTRDAVQFFGDVFPGFGGFDEFLFHGLKVLV